MIAGRHGHPEPRDLHVANVSQRAIAALDRRPLSVDPHARAFDRRRRTIVKLAERDRRCDGIEPRRLLRLPSVKGRAGAGPSRHRPTTSADSHLCIEEAKVAVVPGEAFGAPGYFRMSYALVTTTSRRADPPGGSFRHEGA